jgi:hypothetical protein
VRQIKQILLAVIFLFFILPVNAQVSRPAVSRQLKLFMHKVALANANFIFPTGFKEIRPGTDDDFSFDYAIELPGKDFEIWFEVKSQKANMEHFIWDGNPDSLYAAIGDGHARAFAGENNFFPRSIPADVLARYNANAGKSYFINLQDMEETRHYKYALLTILQKNNNGTIMAVCFTNEKGAEFFKNINKAINCIKFKP